MTPPPDPSNLESFLHQTLRRLPDRRAPHTLETRVRAALAAPAPPAPVWRLWLWPSPYAWAALAASWLLILGLNLADQSASTSHSPDRSGPYPASSEIFALLNEQRRLLDELSHPALAGPSSPPRPTPPADSPGACLGPRDSAAAQFA